MKIQDLLFILIFLGLLWLRRPRIAVVTGAVVTGLACFLLSIPLFHFWIFFTAERLTWYGAAFILLSTILNLKYISID